MKKRFTRRITKRERAAVDVLYGSIESKGVVLSDKARESLAQTKDKLTRFKRHLKRQNDRQTPLPGLATK